MANSHSKNILALVSPPDEHIHSFSQPSSPAYQAAKPVIMKRMIPAALPSPESPGLSTFDLGNKFRNWRPETPERQVNLDPILYPDSRRQSNELKPLFEERPQSSGSLGSPAPFLKQQQQQQHTKPASPTATPEILSKPLLVKEHSLSTKEQAFQDSLIDQHYNYIIPKSKATSWSTPKMIQIPKRDEYRLMLDCIPSFRSLVMNEYNTDPMAYLKRQNQENKENHIATKKVSTIKIQPVLKPKQRRVPNEILHSTAQTPRVRKSVPKKQVDRSNTPEVKHRRTAVKKTKADFNYDDVPDYAPDQSTIPIGKIFNVTWNGQPLKLNEDPMRTLLHPSELDLASKLRLPCDQYLKTKRRVFVGRVNNLIKHPSKQFCKTDAQQVGGVDVNKLSQLWQAYDSIGWFNASHFKQHVTSVRNASTVYDPKNTKWVDRQELFGF